MSKTYTYCKVLPSNYKMPYFYISDFEIGVGDIVVIDIGFDNKIKVGLVLSVEECTKNNAPYPVESTKHILRLYGDNESEDLQKQKEIVDKEKEKRFISQEQQDIINMKQNVFNYIVDKNKLEETKNYFSLIMDTDNTHVISEDDISSECLKFFKLSSDGKMVSDYKNMGVKYKGVAYIPKGVEYIDDNVFIGKKINTFYFPKELKNYGKYTFYDKNVKKVIVDKENENFVADEKALYSYVDGKKKLELVFDSLDEEFVVPLDVSIIGTRCFSNNKSLKRIVLSEGVYEFYHDSLRDNNSINEVFISKSVKKFYSCIYNENEMDYYNERIDVLFYIDEENPYLFRDEDSIYEVLDDGTYKLVLYMYDGKGKTLLLDNTSIIGSGSFSKLKNISKVTLPDSVRVVENFSFAFSEINSISVSDNCLELESSAFNHCVHLKNVLIGKNTVFYKDTFENCGSLFSINTLDNNKKYEFSYDRNYNKKLYEIVNGKEKLVTFEEKKKDNSNSLGYFETVVNKFVEYIKEHSVGWYGRTNDRVIYDKNKNVLTVRFAFDQECENVNLVNERINCCEELVEGEHVNLIINDGSIEFKRLDGKSIGFVNVYEELFVKYNNFINVSNGIVSSITPKSKRTWNAKYAVGLIEFEITEKDLSMYSNEEIEFSKLFSYDFLEEEVLLKKYIGDLDVTRVEIPGMFRNKRVVLGNGVFCFGNYSSSQNNVSELIIHEGVKEIGDYALYDLRELKKLVLPNSIEKISDLVFTSVTGEYKDSKLNKDTIYVVGKGSYAEKFLMNYKPDKFYVKKFIIVNEDSESAFETAKLLSHLTVYENDYYDCVYVSFNSFSEFSNNEFVVPTRCDGKDIEGFNIKSLPNCVNKLIIPKEITKLIDLNYSYLFSDGYSRLNEVIIDEDNPSYWSDGKAIYTKDKSKLLRFISNNVKEYTVVDGTVEIDKCAFRYMSNLVKLTLPSSIKNILEKAFNECANLEKIIGLEYVQNISDGVFENRSGYIPFYENNDVIIVGDKLVKYNSYNQQVIIVPDGIREISYRALGFENSNDIVEEIILPNSLRKIGAFAFANRKHLKKIIIPDGIKKLENNLFSLCENLEYIYIPSSVEEIDVSCFPCFSAYNNYRYSCNFKLKNIDIDPNNMNYSFSDGVLYNKDKTEILMFISYNEAILKISEGVKVLNSNLFYDNEFIQMVILPESLEIIGKSAFERCSNLKSVTFPRNFEVIGDQVFSGCHSLNHVVWPDNLKVIGKYSFAGTGFVKLNLPNTIEEIGDGAFSGLKAKSVVLPKSVQTIGWGVFSYVDEIIVYDSFDANAKNCNDGIDTCNGNPNSLLGFIGIGSAFAMWECAANHEWTNYTITVKSAETDEVKYKVWMGSDEYQRNYFCFLSSGWGHNATFAFKYLDNFFNKIRGDEHKKKVAEYRLAYPYELSDESRQMYDEFLRKAN